MLVVPPVVFCLAVNVTVVLSLDDVNAEELIITLFDAVK